MTTATQTQIRRDTATNLTAATPASGELGYDTTNKRLVIGDGSTAGGIKCTMAKDLQNQTFIAGTVGGTGDVITLTNSPAITAYASNQKFSFKAGASNTTAATINVDGLGAKNIKKMLDNALASLVANDIISGGEYEIIYDGTQFQILGLPNKTPSVGALVYLGTFTASGSATLDITSAISSTYNDYRLVLDNLLPASVGVNLLIRMSSDNGSSFDSAAHYAAVTSGFVSSSSTATINNQNGASSIRAVTTIGSGSKVSGTIDLFAVNTATFQSVDINLAITDGTNATASKGAGMWSNSAAYNAVQFLMSSGNITSGNVKIYGIAKA